MNRLAAIDRALLAIKQARAATRVATTAYSDWRNEKISADEALRAEKMRAQAMADATSLIRALFDVEPWVSPTSAHVERTLVAAARYLANRQIGSGFRDPLTAKQRRTIKMLVDQRVRQKQINVKNKKILDPKLFTEEFGDHARRDGDWIPLGRGGKLTDEVVAQQDARARQTAERGQWAPEDTVTRKSHIYGDEDKKRGRVSRMRSRAGYRDPEPLE